MGEKRVMKKQGYGGVLNPEQFKSHDIWMFNMMMN